jgi:hypothetical protein
MDFSFPGTAILTQLPCVVLDFTYRQRFGVVSRGRMEENPRE